MVSSALDAHINCTLFSSLLAHPLIHSVAVWTATAKLTLPSADALLCTVLLSSFSLHPLKSLALMRFLHHFRFDCTVSCLHCTAVACNNASFSPCPLSLCMQLVVYSIAGNIGGHKIWWICHERHLAVFKFGGFRSPRDRCHKMSVDGKEKTLRGQRLSPQRSCSQHAALPSTSLQVFALQPSCG